MLHFQCSAHTRDDVKKDNKSEEKKLNFFYGILIGRGGGRFYFARSVALPLVFDILGAVFFLPSSPGGAIFGYDDVIHWHVSEKIWVLVLCLSKYIRFHNGTIKVIQIMAILKLSLIKLAQHVHLYNFLAVPIVLMVL